jgi:hypothetical protein
MKIRTAVRLTALATLAALAANLVQGMSAAPRAASAADPLAMAGAVTALTPLPPPSAPVASGITSISATLNWTSGGGPVRRLRAFQLVDGVWRSYGPLLGPAATSLPLTDLNPNTTYAFAVQAYATPNSGYSDSPLSEPGTFTTPAVAIE